MEMAQEPVQVFLLLAVLSPMALLMENVFPMVSIQKQSTRAALGLV